MSNPDRKMVTIKKIDEVRPIKGADRIEVVIIGGWQVVVSKADAFKPGDLVAYYEIDSFLPADDERYKPYQSDSPKEMLIDDEFVVGSVLKTRKYRGVYSQGLCLRPQDVLPDGVPESEYEKMCEQGTDISELANVCEYVRPMVAGFVGVYDPYCCGPHTNAERIQNISQEIWDLVKRTEYFCSIKVDGTSISLVYDDRINEMTYYSHFNRFDISTTGIPRIVAECAERQGLKDFCERNHMVSVQAELVGPKFNSDRLGLGEHKLMVFSIWSVHQGKYLDPYQTLLDFDKERTHSSLVPKIDLDLSQFERPQDFITWTDGIKSNVTKGRYDEGVVVHILDHGDLNDDEWFTLYNALGSTMQVKAISRVYQLKAKE